MRTRGLREFLFGLQGGQLGPEGLELVLKLDVVGGEGEDIHYVLMGSWGLFLEWVGSYLGIILCVPGFYLYYGELIKVKDPCCSIIPKPLFASC